MTIRRIQRPFDVKSVGDNGTFAGYGAVFGNLDSYRDIIMPGAFVKTLQDEFASKGRKVPMLWQHQRSQPIGVYTSLKEDSVGLYVEGEINMDVQQGREAFALMKQGALTGLSIGYNAVTEKWLDDDKGTRELLEVKLWEISPVTFPANDESRINTVKSIEGLTNLSDVEDFLRDACSLSRKETVALIARIKSASAPSDSVAEKATALNSLYDTIRNL